MSDAAFTPSEIQGGAPRILIVDDDPIIRTLMYDTLEDAGYVVYEAHDGEEALEDIVRVRPDLLIVDAVMPAMDGFAVCRAVRALPATEDLPILMATGLDDDVSVADAYEAGATDFIAKPINWINLAQRVRYLLRAADAFAEIKTAKTAAEDAAAAKSEFLATMGHELRTPLNAIIGFANLLRDQEAAAGRADAAEYAGLIASSGAHLLANVNDILDFARAEAGSMTLDLGRCDIAAIVRAAADAALGAAKRERVRIDTAIEAAPVIRGDADRLHQIVVNLLSNAVRFSHDGGDVVVAVRTGPDGGAEIAVSDKGIGIADADLPKALAPFGQVDSKLARKYDGVGIGLPLTQRLVALHGGTLSIESEPGAGTTVTVRLPGDGTPARTDAAA